MKPQNVNSNRSAPIAVVILNWNGSRLLREFLPEVVATTDPAIARVIVADNGSDDDSLEVLRAEFPGVDTICLDRNYGFAGGYNKVIDMLHTPYVVLLNSDVATSVHWVNVLYEFMEKNPDVGACQPKLLSYNDSQMFEYAGAAGGFIDRNGYPYCRGRIFATCEKDEGQYDTNRDVFWASGAALMVRTELYKRVGGLDTAFFAHMEEIDLCWRMLMAGYRVCAVSDTAVYHLGGGSLPNTNPHKTYLNFRNNLLMLYKNLPRRGRTAFLIRRRLLDTVAWAKYVVTFKFKFAAAIVKAHRDFAKMKRIYDTDPQIDMLRIMPGSRVNILIQYYLRGHKRFSQLGV